MGAPEPEREIANVTGDLYRFRQTRFTGMFLVTSDGIIVVDPTSPELAAWLKERLDERFGLPVKYVIYSHSHNDDMTVVLFPAERTIYTADFLTPNRLARTVLDGGYLPDWIESLRKVEELDFDIAVPGHESPGTKAQMSEQARYMEDLYTAVSAGIAAGGTEKELVDTILLANYSHVIEYEFSRAGNVSGAYEILMSTPGEH